VEKHGNLPIYSEEIGPVDNPLYGFIDCAKVASFRPDPTLLQAVRRGAFHNRVHEIRSDLQSSELLKRGIAKFHLAAKSASPFSRRALVEARDSVENSVDAFALETAGRVGCAVAASVAEAPIGVGRGQRQLERPTDCQCQPACGCFDSDR